VRVYKTGKVNESHILYAALEVMIFPISNVKLFKQQRTKCESFVVQRVYQRGAKSKAMQ
jgi:hypothetical protein